MRSAFSVLGHALSVNHSGNEVVHAHKDRGHFRNDVAGVTATVIHEARIALLRHGRGHVRVFSSLLQNDPGAALSVLHHDVVDHGADVHADGSGDRRHFKRKVNRRLARTVKGVQARAVKAKELGHVIAVQGPARTV